MRAIDFRLTFTLELYAMTDWLDKLTDAVSGAQQEEEREETRRRYILHRAEILKNRGSELWMDFVRCCQNDIAELNGRIALRFPGDDRKQIVFVDRTPGKLLLQGKSPSFSMEATYNAERHTISFSCTRHNRQGSDGSQDIFSMELDANGD